MVNFTYNSRKNVMNVGQGLAPAEKEKQIARRCPFEIAEGLIAQRRLPAPRNDIFVRLLKQDT